MANPWDSDKVIGTSSGSNPWDNDQVITPVSSPKAAPKPEKSTLAKIADRHPGVAAAETALNLGTGTIAAPLSGLAGLGAAATKALGLTKIDPADVVRNVGSALTYEPRTEGGKAVTDVITKPFQWLGQGADVAGSKVAEVTGSPLLGAGVNTAIQAAPALVGKVLKKPASARLANETEALQKAQAENLPRDTAIKEGRAEGYVYPPSVTGRNGGLTSFFQGAAGSTALDYGASFKNQPVSNKLIKEELGLPVDEAITRQSLSDYRTTQGEAYRQVKAVLPKLKVTQEFNDALLGGGSKFAMAKAEFPRYFENPEIKNLINTLSKKEFTSDAAIEMQKVLRNDGYKNLKAFDDPKKQQLGDAQLNAAKAIDDLIDQNLQMQAPPGVKNFQSKLATNLQEARRRIAQSYVVEKALNDATGNVSARTLAKMWEKGEPLTGGLEKVAMMAKAFPKQLRDVDKLPSTASERISNLDVAKATGLAALGHGTLGALATVGRAAAKPILLSDWYQALGDKQNPYVPGRAYTLPAQVLNSPYAGLATIPRPPQDQP